MLAAKVLQTGLAERPWLVWLHGLLGRADEWALLASLCADWPSLALDLPGHGDSAKLNCQNFEQLCDEITCLLHHRGIKRYWLIGYSLGGRIALYYACLKKPIGLQGVIVEGSNLGLSNQAEREQRCQHDAIWAQRFRAQEMHHVLTLWYQQPLFADLTQQQRQALIAQRVSNQGDAIASMLQATSLGRQPYLVPALQQLSVPYHLLCGSQDIKCQHSWQAAGLYFDKIYGAGHNAHLSHPQEFVTLLKHYLNN